MAKRIWVVTVNVGDLPPIYREGHRSVMEPHCDVAFERRPNSNMMDIVYSNFWWPDQAYETVQAAMRDLKSSGVDVFFHEERSR